MVTQKRNRWGFAASEPEPMTAEQREQLNSQIASHDDKRRKNRPLYLAIVGGIAAVIGFLLLYTPLFLKYGGGTLSDVHSVCDSGLGVLARGFDSQVGSACSSVSNWFAFATFLLWAGIVTAISGGIWYVTRLQRKEVN